MTETMGKTPLACVMGDLSLIRAIGSAGIPCAVVGRPGSPDMYSRFTRVRLDWGDFARDEDWVDALVAFAASQPMMPVLYYQGDAELLLVSRHRQKLGKVFRFVIGDEALVEDLVDKDRFRILAESLQLPVPKTSLICPGADHDAHGVDLRFPIVIKPLTRDHAWDEATGKAKALSVETPGALDRMWPRLAGLGAALLAQEMVPGPESAIESYHVYVDPRGEIAGEFTGRKIRTYPVERGHSTSVEITDARDVARLGRDIVRKLGLKGVAKLDFKRGPDGVLWLLEVNPRFNLWHHLGAAAGLNIPALVYADVLGLPRPAPQPIRVGARWCRFEDRHAAKELGVPFLSWLTWFAGCEARSLTFDDQLPFIMTAVAALRSKMGIGLPSRKANAELRA